MLNKLDKAFIQASTRLTSSQTAAEVPDAGKEVAVTGKSRSLERGMATAEYAVGILAAVAFAMVLYQVVTSHDVENTLLKYIVELIGKFGAKL